MTYITDIRYKTFKSEYDEESAIVQIQYATDEDYFHVVVDRNDDSLDMYVCDNDDIYNGLCKWQEEYVQSTIDDTDFEPDYDLDNLTADAKEKYWSNLTMWNDDYKESNYSKEIEYAIYKLDQLLKGEEISEPEAFELENIEFEIPDYPRF